MATFKSVTYAQAVINCMVRTTFMKSLIVNISTGMNLKNTFSDRPTVVCVFGCDTSRQYQPHFCPICGDYSNLRYDTWRLLTTIPDNIICSSRLHDRELMRVYYRQLIQSDIESIAYWQEDGEHGTYVHREAISHLKSDINRTQALLDELCLG